MPRTSRSPVQSGRKMLAFECSPAAHADMLKNRDGRHPPRSWDWLHLMEAITSASRRARHLSTCWPAFLSDKPPKRAWLLSSLRRVVLLPRLGTPRSPFSRRQLDQRTSWRLGLEIHSG